MRLLVTGANGFVGSALCEYLLINGERVKGSLWHVDSQVSEGVDPVIVGELNAQTVWGDALVGVDVVIHTAARVHVMADVATDPLTEYRRVNVAGTLNLACQAAEAGVKRLVFISSIKVNGEETILDHPYGPTDIPAPVDPYGASKLEAEEGLRQIAEQTGMEVVIVRPPLVYGPGVRANFLSMMRWLNRGVPLPLGRTNNKRSLVALENLVDFLYCCALHPGAANQTFMVSDGEDLSTAELLKRMAAALGKRANLIPLPQSILYLLGSIVGKKQVVSRLLGSLQVDSSAAREVLGWQPVISVDRALEKVAKAYVNEKNI